MCRLCATVLLLGLALPLAAGPAGAADRGSAPDPRELWSAYPLRERERKDAGSASRKTRMPMPPTAGDILPAAPDRSSGPGPGLSGLVIAIGALALGGGLWLLLRRRVPAPVEVPSGPAPGANGRSAPGRNARLLPATTPSAPPEVPAHLGPPAGAAVVAYISFGAADSELGAPGLVEQEVVIRERCDAEGWRLEGVHCDDPRTLAAGNERPGLTHALERIETGESSCLLVSQLDRLGGTVVELGGALDRLGAHGAALVSLDDALDTSSEQGAMVTDVLRSIARWERDRIAAGTRAGHALARAAGRPISRPSVNDRPALQERIARMRAEGMTLQAIADTLNREGIPTVRGGRLWRPSSVQVAAGYKRPRPKPQGRPAEET